MLSNYRLLQHQSAHALLVVAFEEEFTNLDTHTQVLIERDYLDALNNDSLPVEEYRRRIGEGNLASYGEVMCTRERRGWEATS